MEVTQPQTIECPYCAETINAKSKKCRHCGEVLDPQMRDIEALKRQSSASPHVFMNSGGGAASSSSAAAAVATNGNGNLRRFPHWFHVILVLFSGGLWIPVYLIMYLLRNKRYYY